MITAIINVLEQVAPVVGERYGLCTQETDEKGDRHVVQYVGGGQGRGVEGVSWSYWRVTGPIKQTDVDSLVACAQDTKHSVPLRFVVCGEREVCGPAQLNSTARAMRSSRARKGIEQSLGATLVELRSVSVEIDPDRARSEFVSKPVPLQLAIGYIDMVVEVTASDACLLECDPTGVNIPAY